MKYFPKDRYFVGEEALLERQKRKLAMKYHPDRGGRESDFVAMMREYEKLKSNLSVRRTSEPKPTVEKPRPTETDYPLWIEVLAWICESIKTADGILSAIPSNVRGFVLFFVAMASLLSGLGFLYAMLVIATLLKKHWFAFFGSFLFPIGIFDGIGTAPQWFETFSAGLFLFPIIAVLFVPGFVEPDGRTEEERKEALDRSFKKMAEWL